MLGLLGENQNTRVESLQLEDEKVIRLVLVTLGRFDLEEALG